MKKIFYTIVFTAIFTLIAIPVLSQNDSTTTGAIAQSAASGIIDLLGALGVKTGGWGTVVVFLFGILFRLYEKRRIKTRYVKNIDRVTNGLPIVEHTTWLRRFINNIKRK